MSGNCCKIADTIVDEVKRCVRYDWVIKNYSSRYYNKHSAFLESPQFSIEMDTLTDWTVELKSENKEGFLTLNLKKGSYSKKNEACIHGSLLSVKDGFKVYVSNTKSLDEDLTAEKTVHSTKFDKCQCLPASLSDDELIVRLEVISASNLASNTNALESDLTIEKFYGIKEFTDLRIEIKNRSKESIQVFNVHKCILGIRSEYFSEMFVNGMKKGKIVVADVSGEVMQEVLRYIYTGKVEESNVHMADLYIAADKFKLHALKKLCKEKLVPDLNIDNIVDSLILADRLKISDFKQAALSFYTSNKKKIVKTSKFKTAIQNGLPASILIDLIGQ